MCYVCIYSMGSVCGYIMFSLMAMFKRMCASLFNRNATTDMDSISSARPPFATQHSFSITLPPPPSLPLLPDFDFRPSDSLLATMGEGVEFIVANPLDLALQERNLMASVLVVEVKSPGAPSSMLWFRFDSASMVTRGVSVCRLFSDDNSDEGGVSAASNGGVCGWVIDRKRM
jgi:hypothetical protein